MDTELYSFLTGRRLLSDQVTDWGTPGVPYPVQLRWYACSSFPPDRFVVSVRAVVFQGDEVLVLRDKAGGQFVVPGGHRRSGETVEETLVREVIEECGWRAEPIRVIGALHIHASGPPRSDRSYPYPDSVHVAYAARAVEKVPNWRLNDGWVVDSSFVPAEVAIEMELDPGQHALLELAWAAVQAG